MNINAKNIKIYVKEKNGSGSVYLDECICHAQIIKVHNEKSIHETDAISFSWSLDNASVKQLDLLFREVDLKGRQRQNIRLLSHPAMRSLFENELSS